MNDSASRVVSDKKQPLSPGWAETVGIGYVKVKFDLSPALKQKDL